MKNKEKYNAVVLGLDINGLGIVRALGKMELKVHGIYKKNNEVGRFSKYCTAIKINDGNKDQLINYLKKIGDNIEKTSFIRHK